MKDKNLIDLRYDWNIVYFIRRGNVIKIGKTTLGSLRSRQKSLQTANSSNLSLLGIMLETKDTQEKDVHRMFHYLRKSGEWFEETVGLIEFIEYNAIEPPTEEELI